MRLQLALPQVKPMEIYPPTVCPYGDCGGRHLRHHQTVSFSYLSRSQKVHSTFLGLRVPFFVTGTFRHGVG